MAVQGGEDVYVTLLLSDSYLPGALVLAHSLRDAGTKKKLAVMVTLDTVSAEVITQLKTIYDHIIPVPRIKNEKPANLYLMNRPDLHSAFTKVNLWKQTQFRKLVYIDADVIAYRAPDELFDLPHSFAAAPDIGWPDLFNTGVMVLSPSMGDYYALMAMAERGISFDGADQGLLNMHFKNSYHRLPFTYNVTPSAHYQYLPAYRHFQSSINMVHFIGPDKPWAQGRDANTGDSPFNEMVGRWWAVYDRHYRKEEASAVSQQQQQQQHHHRRPSPPEIVQHFVKGEFQPRISYVVPIGEPSQDPGVVSHGQHYEYPTQHSHSVHHEHHHHEPQYHPHQPQHEYQQHHHETPQAQYQQSQPHHPPPHDEYYQHQHHQHQHQHQEHHDHHHHHHHHQHQEQHHPPPQHHVSEQSQPGAPYPPPEQSFSTPSASFSSIPETQAEARKEQVSDHHHPPGPSHHEPEHKQEPPRPPEQPSWDAQRHPPPADSRPEAFNFPQTHYEMSSDAAPFVPPERYPSPPRNMWYEVPRDPPAPPTQRPVAIFPWERHQPRASRTFAHAEFAPEPSISDESKAESLGQSRTSDETRTTAEASMTGESSTVEPKSEPTTPTTPTIRITPSDPWTSFTRTNAWDEVPEIERYVDALQKHRRTKSQGASGAGGGGLRLSGLGLGQEGQRELQESFRRRGSKVTDFPSAAERPSLPVTPAPIRRPKFWGVGGPGFGDEADNDDDGQLLPAAEGVPPQSDWDPVAQLQKLAKQQSEALLMKLGGGAEEGEGVEGEEGGGRGGGAAGAGTGTEPREIPTRPLPFGSEDIRSPTYVAQSAVLSPQPVKSPRSVQSLLVGSDQAAATPRSAATETTSAATAAAAAASSGHIPEPSYQGPGAAWEKDEDVPLHGVASALPTDEERDVLET